MSTIRSRPSGPVMRAAPPPGWSIRRRPIRRVLVGLATGLAVLSVAGVAGAAILYRNLTGNITVALLGDELSAGAVEDPQAAPAAAGAQPPPAAPATALDILVIGSDTREGEAGVIGGGIGMFAGARSDTTMIVHLSADRTRADIVSIPRDSMVEIPMCETDDGNVTEPGVGMFNSAFAIGGARCTVRTVEHTTGVQLEHLVVLDFKGFADIVDAMGGVEIYLPEAMQDHYVFLDLPAGQQRLTGAQALAYVRARKDVGDGSDLGRIERQQNFLSAVVAQASSEQLLARPDRVIGVLTAGSQSLTVDQALASGPALASLAASLSGIGPDQVHFTTVPNEAWPVDRNRVVWTPQAEAVWSAMRNDTPVTAALVPAP